MKRLIIITALLALSVSSYAEQWQILGTRPMGMGGAFVAVAQGPIAQYWNPGGLVKSAANVSGMEIPVGVNAEFTGNIIENASQIGDMADKFSAIQTSQRGGTPVGPEQMSAFVKTLTLMNDMNDPGKGALFEIAGGVNFKFSKVALSVNNFTSMGLNPTIDVINIGLSNVGGVSGIKFTAYNQSSLDNASYTSAAGTLKTSLDGLGASLIPLLCGTNNCTTLDGGVNGITDTTQLANAIANFANANGITPAQLLDAASTISQYSTEAQPLITAGASGAPYSENTSNLTVAGASFMEIAAGYAWDMKMLSGLSLGANLKMINGRTALTSFHFLSEGDTKDAFTLEDTKSSWRPAADVGLLWNVRSKYPNFPLRPKIGLVIRNINSPRFDM
ncbi:MAG: conjugal transfer protein TraF, partial [Elusimicrobia bacterium]|nr:conjugal transfer protein TraF [Elusimicrobiota bacterium]